MNGMLTLRRGHSYFVANALRRAWLAGRFAPRPFFVNISEVAGGILIYFMQKIYKWLIVIPLFLLMFIAVRFWMVSGWFWLFKYIASFEMFTAFWTVGALALAGGMITLYAAVLTVILNIVPDSNMVTKSALLIGLFSVAWMYYADCFLNHDWFDVISIVISLVITYGAKTDK